MSEDAKLSPDSSPSVMGEKKRARRLNSRPLVIALVIVGIIVLTLGMVVVQRSGKAKGEVAASIVKSASAYAKAITAEAQAGVVEPAKPLPTLPLVVETAVVPAMEKKVEDSPEKTMPAMSEKTPEKTRVPEEIKRMRDKRFKQVEAAIDSPIKVQVEEAKSLRSGTAEISSLEQQIATLGQRNDASYADRLAALGSAGGESGETDYSQRGDLSRMNQFADGERNWLNPIMPEAPPTAFIIRTGSVIPATLISGINSDLPGQIVGQVAQDVYDTPTGRHLLIPQGSRLVGEYSSQIQYGQSRVFAVWQRIIFPDGKALDLGSMPGSTGAGYAGFRDRVNNHYVRIFGSAIMMSGILAGVEMTQDNGERGDGDSQRMADALSEALGNQLGGVMAEMLSRNMSIAPTLEIRPGYRLNVMLVKDLVFHGPYQGFDYVRDGGR